MKRICDITLAEYLNPYRSNRDGKVRVLDLKSLSQNQKNEFARSEILLHKCSTLANARMRLLISKNNLFHYLGGIDRERAVLTLNRSFKKDCDILFKEIHLIEKRLPFKRISEKQQRRFRKIAAKLVVED